MRSVLAIAALLLVAPPAPAASGERTGWEDTRWGMTLDELRALYHSALRAPAAGEAGDAVVGGAAIQGCPAEARLFLGTSGLERIVVVSRPRGACAGLEKRFESRWGRPDSQRREPGDLTLEWRFPFAHVTLEHVRVADASIDWEGVLLTYEPARESAERR